MFLIMYTQYSNEVKMVLRVRFFRTVVDPAVQREGGRRSRCSRRPSTSRREKARGGFFLF